MYLARFKMSKYSSFSLLPLPSVVSSAPGSIFLEERTVYFSSVYIGCSFHLHIVFFNPCKLICPMVYVEIQRNIISLMIVV